MATSTAGLEYFPGGICIEVRPLLSCANIFLQFPESLKLLKDSLSINVNTTAISISLRKQNAIETKAYLDLSEHFDIESHTICNLIVEEHNVSFRISIKNIKPSKRTITPINNGFSSNSKNGTGKDNKESEKEIPCNYNGNINKETELIKSVASLHLTKGSAPTIDKDPAGLELPFPKGNINNNDESKDNKIPLASLKPEINIHLPLTFYCSNCESPLTTSSPSQKYTRILEFPTGSVDSCEFFCHHGPNLNDKLIPAIDDIFYGFHYIVLNANNIIKAVKIKEEHIYCRLCLQLLGITILNGMAFKLWNETLRLKYEKDKNAPKEEDFVTTLDTNDLQTLYKTLTRTEQIKQLIFFLINEATVDSSNFVQFTKVCLKTTYANRQQGYLLLHILEQRLPVLNYHYNESLSTTNHNHNNQESNQQSNHYHHHHNHRHRQHLSSNNEKNDCDILCKKIQLSSGRCCKLLYNLIDLSLTEDTDLIAHWLSNVSILTQDVSPKMFEQLLTELEQNTKLIPLKYRQSIDDTDWSCRRHTNLLL